jgi:hypothetical protein
MKFHLTNQLVCLGTAFFLGSCMFIPKTPRSATSPSSLPAIGESQWRTVSPEGSGFTFSMPGKPKPMQQSVNTAAGTVKVYVNLLDLGSTAYTVMYSDYPADVIAQSDPQTMFNNARDNMLKNRSGQLLAERAISLNGYPGKELKVSLSNNSIVMIARMYLVKQRLYQAIVGTSPDRQSSPDINRFLNSMKLN